MSYVISIYHADIKKKIDGGLAIEDFEHSRFEEEDLARFLIRLIKYGYRPESEHTSMKAYVKEVDACPIQVHVFDTQISFSVPYWPNSKEAIFAALQDASELSDSNTMVMHDAQNNEWIL
ncbi:hypothetical protein ACO0LF_26670 [Undibacterium sp. Di27W]|uniref:hypothetical protein n=1 Tax=Undibacterium sp. Di27W TaxID=3413036 RepID=UPI003BF33B6D